MKKTILLFTLALQLSTAISFAQSGTTGPLTWNISGGTLTISGTGAMPDYSYPNYAPWYPYRNNILSIVVANSVTSIGENAFVYCNSLISVTIGESILTIGYSAFYSCTNLDIINFNAINSTTVYTSGSPLSSDCKTLNIGNQVQNIPQMAFFGCNNLITVTIGESVSSIGENAFGWCFNLQTLNFNAINCTTMSGSISYGITTLTIGNQVKTLPNNAFANCNSLTSVTFGNGLVSIGKYAFSGCSNLPSIVLPNNIISIADGTFNGCSNLISIVIPENVKSIGEKAFNNCSRLSAIIIPENVTTIGLGAFHSSGLTSITIPEGVTNIRAYAFGDCKGLHTVNFNAINCEMGYDAGVENYYPVFYDTAPATVNIGNSVKKIPLCAFYQFNSLVSINIPNSVTVIEAAAFRESGIKSINIPNGVTKIGVVAFCDCHNLTSVTIPESITSIGAQAFIDCHNLQTVNYNAINCTEMGGWYGWQVWSNCHAVTTLSIGSQVQTIPDFAFAMLGDDYYGVTGGLTSVTIPNSVKSIGGYAFHSCKKLTSVTIGNSVESIGWYAFADCYNLTSITIPKSVKTIENGTTFEFCRSMKTIEVESESNYFVSQDGVLFDKNKTNLIACPGGKTGNYVIPNTVKTIKGCAFAGCSNLTSITIPKTVTTIETWAFMSMSEYDDEGYLTGNGLTTVINLNPIPISLSSGAFENPFLHTVISECTLKVPTNSVSTYKNATVWKDFGNIVGVEVGIVETHNCASLQVYPNPTTGELTIDNEQLTINNVEIFDVYGKNHHLITSSSNHFINIAHLPAGIYFLKIATEAGDVVKKVIKQ